jgi:hypothetical protein
VTNITQYAVRFFPDGIAAKTAGIGDQRSGVFVRLREVTNSSVPPDQINCLLLNRETEPL